MSGANASGVLESLPGPLSQCLDAESARRVAEFRIAEDVQTRVASLAERMDNAVRRMFSVSKEDLAKAEAKWKRSQARKKRARKSV